MGMFDHYEPRPPLACPACGKTLSDWQGKEGPCALFVWRQGERKPVEQRVPEESRCTDAYLEEVLLPETFEIYDYCCGGSNPVEAVGHAPDGTWTRTELITADNAKPRSNESKSEFKARVKWLSGKGG